MKLFFHNEWNKKRLKKTINIFGKDWFFGKEILELGACHGDFGFKLLNLGANVTFTDARLENLEILREKVSNYNFSPTIKSLNQEVSYDFQKQFDLIIHFGVLYNLENWKNDLKSALNNTNIMLLETKVAPVGGIFDKKFKAPESYYSSYSGTSSHFSEESVEEELKNLGCKFLKLKDQNLNTRGWDYNTYIYHLYDWDIQDVEKGMYKNINSTVNNGVFTHVHFRRFWLVLK